jgi:hypothetical protein
MIVFGTTRNKLRKKLFIYTVISSVISFLAYFCFSAYSKNVARITDTTYMREQDYIKKLWLETHRHIEIQRPNLKDDIKTQHKRQTMRMSGELYCLRIQITAFLLWRLVFRFGKIQNFAVESP